MKTKNIVISGTSFWNPGDDFVRQGVINILKETFPDTFFNFYFYDFNPDNDNNNEDTNEYSNKLTYQDLLDVSNVIDMIVIVGLSAGNEIEPLYKWISTAGLLDKVYLIGAGYENNYCDWHLNQNSLIQTIFKSAKLITGRTEKHPDIIDKLNKYNHLSCPAILAEKCKSVLPILLTEDKNIDKVLFSIQIPFGDHSIERENYLLIMDILEEIIKNTKYEIGIICHYKDEFNHFININKKIPIYFSSFYQDYKNIYEQYDIVISTRLHSCIYAASLGMPSIVINSSPRIIETIKGMESFLNRATKKEEMFYIYNSYKNNGKFSIMKNILKFKKDLLSKYKDLILQSI